MNTEKNGPRVIRISGQTSVMLGGAVALSTVVTLLAPVPIVVSWLVLRNLVEPAGGGASAWLLCLWAVAAIVIRWLCQMVSIRLSHLAAENVSGDLRQNLLLHIGDLPIHWHSNQTMGGLKKTFSEDIGHIDNFIAHHIPDTVSAILLPIAAFCLLAAVDWRMALLMVVLLAACIAIQVGSFRQMGKNDIMRRYATSLMNINTCAVEFVNGMPVVKIFNRGMESFAKMRQAIEGFRNIQLMVQHFFAPRWALFTSMTVMPFTFIAVAGTALHLGGSLSLADLALFLMLSGSILSPLAKLVRLGALLTEVAQSTARIRAILSVPCEQRGRGKAADVTQPGIVVENLSVSFGEKAILHDLSFTVEPGSTVAIVGPSGSGKSTLAAVLAGMEEVSSGSVRVGGHALRDFSAYELSRLISPVFQSPFIFTGTIAENIALGCGGASQKSIEEAARVACCEEFILAFPEGYATVIGAGGSVHLSGGQKQRIALARTLLRNTPVIVLDEATAYADAENEARIQQGLSALLRERTVVVVAHRLSSIAGADQILVMQNGTIAERGKHAELLEQQGQYARMWEAHNTARRWTIPSAAARGGQCAAQERISC